MDDDILEVGEDGVFEITSTKTVKQAPIVQPDYTAVTFAEEEETENREELLNNINPGEYKVFKADGHIYILIKLHEDDAVRKVSVTGQELTVQTVENCELVVSLKNVDVINPKTGTCTAWKDYVTIKYAILSS